MGVKITTAHAVPDKFGTGPYGENWNGFTAGNMAGGLEPTELSPDWCDAVTMEINNAASQYKPFSLDFSAYTDLAYALDQSHTNRRPINTSVSPFTLRTQTNLSLAGTNGLNCLVKERTQHTSAAANGTVINAGLLSLSSPTNTQNYVEWRGVVVQATGLTTNYAQFHHRCSVRNSAGVVTIQNQGSVYTYIPGIAYTFTAGITGANVSIQVTIPAAPVAVHNILCHVYCVQVTSLS